MDYKELLIDEEISLLEAMEKLDKCGKRTLFIVKDKDVLTAALSDGDIRRWLLSGGSLNEKVSNAANYSPLHILEGERDTAKEIMKKRSIQALPIVDGENRIIDIIYWNDEDSTVSCEHIDAPVVIMAGGFGTRLYPYTKILPKPLIPVGDLPIAEHIINSFKKYGIDEYHFIVNHKKNMIKAYFNEIEKDYIVNYADEDVPLGTGGGLSLLKGKIDKTFIFTTCDILVNENFATIYKFHKEHKNLVTMICSLKNFRIPYGVVEMGNNGTIEAMREKPSISFFTNTGCYIVEPEVLNHIEPSKPIGFPDVIENLKAKGFNVGAFPISEGSWLDMGQLDELEKMKNQLNLD